MKYQVTVITENKDEVRELLQKAESAKERNKDFPFRVEGSYPVSQIDLLIHGLRDALVRGRETNTFTFSP